jgi:predicted transcriptional regulator
MTCGKLEIEILNTFWSMSGSEDITIQDVVDTMSQNGVVRAYTTVKTVMDRLVAKTVLVRYKKGKKFFYSTTISKSEMAQESIKEVAGQFFGGDYRQMQTFIETNCLTDLVY